MTAPKPGGLLDPRAAPETPWIPLRLTHEEQRAETPRRVTADDPRCGNLAA